MKLRKKLLPEFTWPEANYDLCQPKLDGWFCRVLIAGGRAIFTARNGSVLYDHPVSPAIPDAILQGEIIHGTAWAKKQANCGHFFAFDFETSESHPYGARLQLLRNFLAAFHLEGVSLMETHGYNGKNFEELQNRVVAGGFEGLIFRDSRSLENEILVSKEKRSWDFYVTQFYDGQRGRAILGLSSTPGGPEIMRCMVPRYELEHAQIDDCAEIEGSYLTAKGAVQGCSFYRWRPDKNLWEK